MGRKHDWVSASITTHAHSKECMDTDMTARKAWVERSTLAFTLSRLYLLEPRWQSSSQRRGTSASETSRQPIGQKVGRTDSHNVGQTWRQLDREYDRQTGSETARQTDRKSDCQTES